MTKAVAYYRVSTKQQDQSGLGLEAQQHSVLQFVRQKNLTLERTFTEVRSGKMASRPALDEALQYCHDHDATLLIAKLDRLGRNVAFIAGLMESQVKFVVVEHPNTEPVMLHILAAFGEYELKQISLRTKLALQAAKARGVKLGTFGATVQSKINRDASFEFAHSMKSIIEGLKENGFTTIREITLELNRLKIPTYRKYARWHAATVHNVLKRNLERSSDQTS